MCSISVEVAEGAMSLAQDWCRAEGVDRRMEVVEELVSVEGSATMCWQERCARRVTILEVLRKVRLGMQRRRVKVVDDVPCNKGTKSEWSKQEEAGGDKRAYRSW